jgi:hypothetical protein
MDSRRSPLVGLPYAVTKAAGAAMQANDFGNIGQSDAAEVTHHILDPHVERSQDFLTFLRDPCLNVSRCQQAKRALSGPGPS